jgi:hypothetical protein
MIAVQLLRRTVLSTTKHVSSSQTFSSFPDRARKFLVDISSSDEHRGIPFVSTSIYGAVVTSGGVGDVCFS